MDIGYGTLGLRESKGDSPRSLYENGHFFLNSEKMLKDWIFTIKSFENNLSWEQIH